MFTCGTGHCMPACQPARVSGLCTDRWCDGGGKERAGGEGERGEKGGMRGRGGRERERCRDVQRERERGTREEEGREKRDMGWRERKRKLEREESGQ